MKDSRSEGPCPTSFPEDWRIVWTREEPAGGTADLRLDRRAVAGVADGTSIAFFRHGISAWSKPDNFLLSPVTLYLEPEPTLDDACTLWMMIRARNGFAPRPEHEALCRYALDARQGLWPDRVRPDHAVQSVYRALTQFYWDREVPDPDGFLREVLAFFDFLDARLQEGRNLLTDDLLGSAPAFARYPALLSRDRDLYLEDRRRGMVRLARVPASGKDDTEEREAALLVLRSPRSTQFKFWARSDPDAPGGQGFPLLLVEFPDHFVVLSSDPVFRIPLGWLVEGLRELEDQAGGKGADWYDGRDHAGSVIASPRQGTRIPFSALWNHVKGRLRCRYAMTRPGRRRVRIAFGSALAVLAVSAWIMVPRPPPGRESHVVARGEPMSPDEVRRALADAGGPGSFQRYALVVGVCSYQGQHLLRWSCNDARAVARLLVEQYGYEQDNVVLMLDDPSDPPPDARRPTANRIRKAIEEFHGRIVDDRSSFLFYYSGHGAPHYGPRKGGDWGYLQPAGFFESSESLDDRGWDMGQIKKYIRGYIPSRHVMLILDACHTGWVGQKGGDELDSRVFSSWSEPAEAALVAAGKGEKAWEDDESGSSWNGHGLMTYWLLRGLDLGAGGLADADENGDGLVVDEELARYVQENVLDSVRRLPGAPQNPRFYRLDEADETRNTRGQFLFVPVSLLVRGPGRPPGPEPSMSSF